MIALVWAGVVVAVVVVIAGCWLSAVVRSVPSPTGDPEMAADLRAMAGRRCRRLAVAVIDLEAARGVRSAFVRAGADTRFEVGSVTKALTGMALADAIDRQELAMDTTVGEVMTSTAGSEVATVTVRELCTHTAGLPKLPRDWSMAGRGLLFGFFGLDPYRGTTPERVVTIARRQHLRARGRTGYSNLGAALLGQLIAERASRDFGSVLQERIFSPLGMSSSVVATKTDKAAHGWSTTGLPRAPWVLDGYGPAGGVVATIDDMAKLAIALLEETAPGAWSMNPVDGVDTSSPTRRSGMFWIIDRRPDGDPMIWHNGATGGYSSFFALYPASRRAVVALANTSRASDQQRIALGFARWHPPGSK